MNHREIIFENIANARDMGGLESEDHKKIINGLLLRSACLATASESDIHKLQNQYHLAKILDLRTEIERKEAFDVVLANVEYVSIPIFDESTAGISHEKHIDKEQLLKSIPSMEELYRQMICNDTCRENLAKAIRFVLEHDFSKGSILWHCTEGKDRCGLVSAILLTILGVDQKAIMEDYMLTNKVNEKKAEQYYQMLIMAGKSETEASMIRNIFLAKEEYLKAAFAQINEQYQNVDVFVKDGLHISNELVDKFKKQVLDR